MKRILITAGPTREEIDPVRFISNHSTGEMGYKLAEAAREAGLTVTLMSGPTYLDPPKGVKFVSFKSVSDLREKLRRSFPQCDVLFMTAAVSDYAPLKQSKGKIKRKGALTIRLRSTPDLLKELSRLKTRQKVAGFCLETEKLEERARLKLKSKKADFIIGNLLSKTSNPFGEGKTSVYVVSRSGKAFWLRNKTKREIARRLIALLVA